MKALIIRWSVVDKKKSTWISQGIVPGDSNGRREEVINNLKNLFGQSRPYTIHRSSSWDLIAVILDLQVTQLLLNIFFKFSAIRFSHRWLTQRRSKTQCFPARRDENAIRTLPVHCVKKICQCWSTMLLHSLVLWDPLDIRPFPVSHGFPLADFKVRQIVIYLY